MRGTPGSAYLQPEPNATELPSSAPGRPKLIELKTSAPSPTPTRAEEHIATTPDCRLRALARRRAPKRTSHYTCWCERNTLRETLGALATWVPATAMLPLPLALTLSLTSSWQQHHCSLSAPRRSAGTAAAARSCGVAAATATMCAEHSRNDVRCRCVPRHSVAPSHLRFAPSSNARSAHSVAPSHLQSLFEGWHGVVVRSLDRQGTAPRVAKVLNLRGVWSCCFDQNH